MEKMYVCWAFCWHKKSGHKVTSPYFKQGDHNVAVLLTVAVLLNINVGSGH